MQEAKFNAPADLAVFERDEFAEFSDAASAVDRRADACFCRAQIVFARGKAVEFELT